MTRLTIAEAKACGIDLTKYFTPAELKAMQPNKYHNTKTEIDGHVFDSQKEADYYWQLKMLKQAGEVTAIELQPAFTLSPGYRRGRKWIRPMVYRADFRVTYSDGRVVVVDVKGMRTKEYTLKKKLLLAKYPNLIFEEV